MEKCQQQKMPMIWPKIEMGTYFLSKHLVLIEKVHLNEMLWFGDTEAWVLSTPKGALIGQAIVPKGIEIRWWYFVVKTKWMVTSWQGRWSPRKIWKTKG